MEAIATSTFLLLHEAKWHKIHPHKCEAIMAKKNPRPVNGKWTG